MIDKVLGAVERPGALKIVRLGGKAGARSGFGVFLAPGLRCSGPGDWRSQWRAADFSAGFYGGILYQRTDALCTFEKEATGGKMLLHEIAPLRDHQDAVPTSSDLTQRLQELKQNLMIEKACNAMGFFCIWICCKTLA